MTVSRNNEPEDDGLRRLDLTGVRCIGGCPQKGIEERPLDLVPRYWSNPSAWDNLPGRIPIEGDAVVVESGWNMIMDIEQTPELASLQINGKLTVVSGAKKEDGS